MTTPNNGGNDDERNDRGGRGGRDDMDGELLSRIQRLISREGGTNEAINTLLNENAQYRDTIRGLRRDLDTERAKVPDGAIVLEGDDAKAWQAYTELGKPDDLKTSLTEKDALANRLSQTERNMRLREAADTLKWDAETLDTLARTPDGKPFDFELKEEEIEGEDGEKRKARIPYIITDAEKEEKRKLADHAKDQWSKFLPVLAPADNQQETPTQSAGGTKIPRQQGGGERKGPKQERGSFYHRPKIEN